VLIIAGFAARVAICCVTWGTVDTMSYLRFAHRIDGMGLLAAYASDPLYNHPPVLAYLSWAALLAAGRDAFGFAIAFRLAMVAADLGSALLLRRIALSHGAGPRVALVIAALYAWNPCALLISGYHFNADPLVAMLSLLAVDLLQGRARPLLGGLVLGLAINIKLIPVLLVPPMLLAARSRREFLACFVGLAVMAIPYLPPLLMEPAFARHVLGYKSSPDPWGILLLLRMAFPEGISDTGVVVAADHPALAYNRWGAWVVLAGAVAWGVLARRFGERFDRYRSAAVAYALLLVLAPGFGVQYLVLVAPLFYVTASRAFATVYGVVAGAFLVAAYTSTGTGRGRSRRYSTAPSRTSSRSSGYCHGCY
jgi:hypothetical protein